MVGILGCMAERLKQSLLDDEKLVDIVVGPDAYRDLPRLLNQAEDGDKGINVLLVKGRNLCGYQPCQAGEQWDNCLHLDHEGM